MVRFGKSFFWKKEKALLGLLQGNEQGKEEQHQREGQDMLFDESQIFPAGQPLVKLGFRHNQEHGKKTDPYRRAADQLAVQPFWRRFQLEKELVKIHLNIGLAEPDSQHDQQICQQQKQGRDFFIFWSRDFKHWLIPP